MMKLVDKIGLKAFLEQFADTPANLAFIEAKFHDADQSTCDTLLDYVDESPYSLRDWVDALRRVGHWLDARNMTMELDDQIGYISCAAASAGPSSNLTHLPSLVDEMLETFGCERAVKK